MSERKNITRNAKRVKVQDRPFYGSIQSNYQRKPENKNQLKLL